MGDRAKLAEAAGGQAPHRETFGRGDHVELAVALLQQVEGDGPSAVFDDGALHRYEPASGLWRLVPRAEQSRIVQSFAGTPIPAKDETRPLAVRAHDVSGAIRLAGDRVARPSFFADAPRGLVFANGFVSVGSKGGQLRSHSPDNRARLGYPFAYPGNVPPLRLLKFLHAVFRDDRDREEKIHFVQEFFGAALLGIAPTYQRCVLAVGEGGNGKSKLSDILIAAMPSGSTCAVAPQTFESEYRRALLAGKRLNVVNELPDADIIASEQFKAIVTGESIDARHIREAPFTFRPEAGHYFASNRLPGTSDQTHAFWRRWVVVSFNRRFEGDPDHDPKIAETITAAELPAIVGWLIEGGARVIRQGGYTIPESHDELMRAWRLSADQVVLFVAERTVTSSDERPFTNQVHDWSAAASLYGTYKQWSQDNGHRPLASNKFGMRMRELGHGSTHTDRGWFYPVRVRRPDEPLTDSYAGPPSESMEAAHGCH